MPTISTPCRDVCRLNDATGLCEGCLRTLDEIARWVGLPEAERLAIMAELPRRRLRAPGKGD